MRPYQDRIKERREREMQVAEEAGRQKGKKLMVNLSSEYTHTQPKEGSGSISSKVR